MKRIVAPLLISALVLFLPRLGFTLDPPHDFTNTIDCAACHTAHKALGGAITKAAGNANLCQSCHTAGGLASIYPFDEADQALPAQGLPSGVSPTGFSHRWDSGASGHVKAVGTPASTGTVQSSGTFTGRYSKTYTITTTGTGGTFSWNCRRWPMDTDACGNGTGNTTGTVGLNDGISVNFSGSFVAGDQWRIFVRTDINQPANAAMAARIFDGKIACSTCHNQHSQAAQPFDPSAPAYGGSGTGAGRHFQRINNDANQMCLDCHSARNVTLSSAGSHPVGLARSIWNGLFKGRASITLPLDKGADGVAGNDDDRVQCMSCHQPHFAPTNDGTLRRMDNITSLCTDCHTLADTASGSHFNTSTGVLWPGGQYGSTFPAITDTSKRGACINCHNPHGWPDSSNPAQDYAKLLVDKQENLCYTCHDGTVTTTANVYAPFNGSTNFQISGGINQRHDVSDADQFFSGGVVECTNCHDPHLANGANKLINPDNWSDGTTTFVAGQPFTKTYSTSNSYFYNGSNRTYWNSSADLDPLNPEGLPAGPSIGPAVEGLHNGDDLGTSGGTYSGAVDQTYTVTISTGGAPGVSRITVTSTGGDSSGPTTVTAFDTFVSVGTLGVQIKFKDGGSGGTPSSIGSPTCTAVCQADHTAATQGTYTGTQSGTYTLAVQTAGTSGNAVLSCSSTGHPCSSPTYTWTDNVFINLGNGVQFKVDDTAGQARLGNVGETWQFSVTAAGGDGVLTSGDTWTIVASAGGATFSEPDYVAFCLTCHDGFPPAGVVMTPGMTDIAGEYFSRDKMGAVAGRTGASIGNGYLKEPWTNQTAHPGEDPTAPYAALNCTMCHDGHGSDSLYHLRTQITVGGVQMTAGGQNAGSQFAPGTFPRWGSTTYSLPCQGGNGDPNCANNPGGSQQDFYYGAWCSFCHEMSSHPSKTETTSCVTSHSHGGGNF